jgi:hypothetical protein
MKLRPEAIAILQVFIDRGCKKDEFIHFTDFGDAIVWEAGYIKDEAVRLGFRELVESQCVIEYSAGLVLTQLGLDATI